MRNLFRTTIVGLASISLIGCLDESEPFAPEATALRRSAHAVERGEVATTVTSPDVRLLDVELRSPEFESPLRYQIPLEGGASALPLAIPAGKGYELTVRGHDVYGERTFEGRAGIEYVSLERNEPLTVELEPVGEGERARATFQVIGQERAPAGLRIVIEADRKEVGEGESVTFRAIGVDERGRRIRLDPSLLRWGVDDPRVGRFDIDPLAPSDPNDYVKFNVHQHLKKYPPKFWGIYLDIVVIIQLVTIENDFVDISAGDGVSCGVRAFGGIECWGSDGSAMLGLGGAQAATLCRPPFSSGERCSVRPAAVSSTRAFSAVSVGRGHVCALEKTTGAAHCWGSNGVGQLGVPRATIQFYSNAPIAVAPPAGASSPLAFASISAGYGITCGVTAAGDEYCWGAGFGETPVHQNGGIRATTAANGFSCRMDGTGVWCPGAPHPRSHAYPFDALGQATTADHVCAINGTQTWCWSFAGTGSKLGNGTPIAGRTPVYAPATLTTVATGMTHSCGLAGTVAYCWGSNFLGELGIDSSSGGSSSPLLVTNGPTTPAWSKISTGAQHTCAIDTAGDAWCWGSNYVGQVGNGTSIDYNANLYRQAVFAPVKVVGQ